MIPAGDSDTALEDRAWRGYDPRAAMPLIAVAGGISAALLAGRWYLDDFTAALIPYAIVLALWPGLLGLTVYRAITYTYRLTDRALLVDRGFRNRPEAPLWLADVNTVEYGGHWIARKLGIGWVKVTSIEGREIVLTAIRNPEQFANCLDELRTRGADLLSQS
jgi:hypothetical protein